LFAGDSIDSQSKHIYLFTLYLGKCFNFKVSCVNSYSVTLSNVCLSYTTASILILE